MNETGEIQGRKLKRREECVKSRSQLDDDISLSDHHTGQSTPICKE